jgi:eukaryotic-like serine/threonine-protein kinase
MSCSTLLHLSLVAFSLTNTQDWMINMELWNEYEGRTIDGDFPLTRLLRPEGRSAFFATSNGTGVPTVIRLIESHFDDAEILARWQAISALDHAHLVQLKKFGQVELDGTSLVYVVMEPVEANLGEVVQERRLTVLETRQVATSLVSALEAMHSHGFVHEHVEPGNVMAVGEEIKLRSDCIREAPEGEDGLEAKRRDVRDFSLVLLRALTQQRTLDAASRDLPLPEPFDQIVRKGISGEWGLREIAAALQAGAAPPAARPVVRDVPVERPVVAAEGALAPRVERTRVPVEEAPNDFSLRKIAYGVGALLLILLLVWYFVHSRSGTPTGAAQETAPAPAVVAQGEDAAPGAVATAAKPNASADLSSPRTHAPLGNGRNQWRVVAYTYNGESLAQQKVAAIAQKHSELRPEVFTPNGRAPYLVTVGGVMSRDEAFALARKVRSEGLPRDSYAQNYTGKSR